LDLAESPAFEAQHLQTPSGSSLEALLLRYCAAVCDDAHTLTCQYFRQPSRAPAAFDSGTLPHAATSWCGGIAVKF
jgi:hypothetical protein